MRRRLARHMPKRGELRGREDEASERWELAPREPLARPEIERNVAEPERIRRDVRSETRRDHPQVSANSVRIGGRTRDSNEAVESEARGLFLDHLGTHLLELVRLHLRGHAREERL